jgi:hypothetical protein
LDATHAFPREYAQTKKTTQEAIVRLIASADFFPVEFPESITGTVVTMVFLGMEMLSSDEKLLMDVRFFLFFFATKTMTNMIQNGQETKINASKKKGVSIMSHLSTQRLE